MGAELFICAGCSAPCQITLLAVFVPAEGRGIECELCCVCHERVRLGDRRLIELIELRLLIDAVNT